jgi:hypothetical protein
MGDQEWSPIRLLFFQLGQTYFKFGLDVSIASLVRQVVQFIGIDDQVVEFTLGGDVFSVLPVGGTGGVELRNARAQAFLGRPVFEQDSIQRTFADIFCPSSLKIFDAMRIMEEAGALMRGNEYETASIPLMQLVAESTCSAYDCEFVALAQDLSIPLVTVDKRILEQFPKHAISLDEFTS